MGRRILGSSRPKRASFSASTWSLLRLQELGHEVIVAKEGLGEAFAREAGDSGFQVVIDYVWGRPAEAFLAALHAKNLLSLRLRLASFKLGKALGRRYRLPLTCCAVQH
jgi:hypothetical protein